MKTYYIIGYPQTVDRLADGKMLESSHIKCRTLKEAKERAAWHLMSRRTDEVVIYKAHSLVTADISKVTETERLK